MRFLLVLILAAVSPAVARAQGIPWVQQSSDSTCVVISASGTSASVTSTGVSAVTTVSLSNFGVSGWLPPTMERALDANEAAALKSCLDSLYAKYQPTADLLFVLHGTVTGMISLPADRDKGRILAIFDQNLIPPQNGTDIAPLAALIFDLSRWVPPASPSTLQVQPRTPSGAGGVVSRYKP